MKRVLSCLVFVACGPAGVEPMQQQMQKPGRTAQQGLECGLAEGTDGSWTNAQATLQSNGSRTDLLLWFGRHASAPLDACTKGSGDVWTCTGPMGTQASPIDPGAIDVTAGAMRLTTHGANDSASAPGTMTAGDSIAFHAGGSELAAFDGTVAAPALPAVNPLPAVVRRGTDLQLTWNDSDAVRIRIGSGRTQLWALGSGNSLTLPASALDGLERGTAWLEVSGYRTREVMAGDVPVCLVAVQQGAMRTLTLGN